MFDSCESLADLNAERIQLLQKDGADPLEINNAYNARKMKILSNSNNANKYIQLNPIILTPTVPEQYMGVPYIGDPTKEGRISLVVPK